ncbi:hypothetical protein [Leptospira brenneri]|nr:hypothetical protein [Leptospira brenneri]
MDRLRQCYNKVKISLYRSKVVMLQICDTKNLDSRILIGCKDTAIV